MKYCVAPNPDQKSGYCTATMIAEHVKINAFDMVTRVTSLVSVSRNIPTFKGDDERVGAVSEIGEALGAIISDILGFREYNHKTFYADENHDHDEYSDKKE